ncbi:MAG: hypothetical protein K2O59_01660 [Lachnospiraceae bacterium]|nr:hypothetical protein [Lachnospiraceae bacterium]MDE7176497.1 hypothetical protein [Lachnospiraceae bacterium]
MMKRRIGLLVMLMMLVTAVSACGGKEKDTVEDAFSQESSQDEGSDDATDTADIVDDLQSDPPEDATDPEEVSTDMTDVDPNDSVKQESPALMAKQVADGDNEEKKSYKKGYYEIGQEDMGYLFLPDTMVLQDAEDGYYRFIDNRKSVEFAYFDYSLTEAYNRYVDGLLNNSQAYYEIGTENSSDYKIAMVSNPMNDGVYDMGYSFLINNTRNPNSSIGIIISTKKDNKEMQKIAGEILASWHADQKFDLTMGTNQSVYAPAQADEDEESTESEANEEQADEEKAEE